jgi:hydrogenase/urease accessory protein HupE
MRFLSTFAATFFLATAAQAHSGNDSASGAAHDMLHAIGGPDHLLAWLGVGLLGVAIATAPRLARQLARSLAARKAAQTDPRADGER